MAKLTVQDWCETSGVKLDALRIAFPKIGIADFAKTRPLSHEDIRAIESYPFRKKMGGGQVREKREKPAIQSVARAMSPSPRFSWPSYGQVKGLTIGALLIAGVVSHAILVWYDCALLWGIPGQIGGAGMFAIVVAAVLLASDPEKFSTSGDALAFVFFVDCAAWFVHYEVFKTPIVSNIITGSLCAFICAASFFALYLYRQFKFA
jgi:hypothetical protein